MADKPAWVNELNESAEFFPRMSADELPEIVVGGVAVAVYVDLDDDGNGRVRVSVHCDTGEVDERLLTEDENVRLRVKVGDGAVFDGK